MHVLCLTGGPVQTNCYILFSQNQSDNALVIDPGIEPEIILHALSDRKICAYLLTHAHFDHTSALGCLPKAPIYLHRLDAQMMQDPMLNAGFLIGDNKTRPSADRLFDHEEQLTVEGFFCPIKFIHTPGHTPGSCVFDIDDILFTGDTLFYQGYGRTDLPGGSSVQERASLRRLFSISGDRRVCPGHGPETTLNKERALFK